MKRKIFIFFTLIFSSFFIADFFYPLDLNALKPPQSPILYDKNGEIMTIRLNENGDFMIYAKNVPEILKKSVLYFEDRYFYYHFGVNPLSIFRAFFHNLTHENRIGASTITMQVARMISKNERTYANKFIEIFRALQLEMHFSKDEILNIYFNLAPYGGNLSGVASAAKFYFNKDLDKLSYSQMALLATIPKNPNKNRLDKNGDTALKNSVLKRLYQAKIIDFNTYKRSKNEPFVKQRLNAIYNAPEFSKIAIKNGIKNSQYELEIHKNLLNLLRVKMRELNDKKAFNAAGVVIDNKTMQVVSFIGSHDQNAKDGRNSALKMKRNVGSTLKPFIYALALENGLITPRKKLVDTQIYIGNYAPQNYVGQFYGVLRASDALAFSLNIPFVALNEKLGQNSLYELLKKANLVDKNADFYGASIALGSAEISLLNLAHLYTIFANNGVLKPLKMAGDFVNNQTDEIALLTPQSAYLTAKALSNATRANLKNAWEFAKNSPKIAFKTGTSYGSRDLYAIGVNQNYTIAVWVGNFNALKTESLTGLNDVSNVVFEMFKLLSFSKKMEFFTQPNGISYQKTCVDEFAFNECKSYENDEQILGVSPINSCESLRGEELDFMLKNAIITQDDVAKSPCDFKTKKPLIVSPAQNSQIQTDTNQSKIMIKCYSFFGKNIHVKINDEPYFNATSGDEILKILPLGEHLVSCLDEGSNFSQVDFKIRR